MSARATVISRLSYKMGFPFVESELSPALRRKIGELEAIKAHIDSILATIFNKQNELAQVQATKANLSNVLFRRRQIEVTVDFINRDISNLNDSLTNLYSTLNAKVDSVSNDIFSELSSSHQAKISLVTAGPSVQTVKETLREVVMIPCAYCRALMPQMALTCPTCGAQRRA